VGEAVLRIIESMAANVRVCVIDADALNALAGVDEWHRRLRAPCILTPHPGEMARLLRSSVEEVQSDRLNVAMKSAREWSQIVVLKGAHTIIAAPDGRACVSPHANPLLATAGTGDVLAGAIAGLVAQGVDAFDAAAAAVFIHGLAAEEAGEEYSDRGMLASELLPALPRAIRTIREGRGSRDTSPLAGLGGLAGLSAFGVEPPVSS
jgi:NAD(P)H-hydrate epimerase